MNRFFNTAGPIRKEDHYCIDPLHRIDLPVILALIEQKKYVVIHAPRQTGKTSYLLSLMEYLNQQRKYTGLYVNIENAQAARSNVAAGMREILNALARNSSIHLKDRFFEDIYPLVWSLTEGQPWLVNALAYEVCFKMKEGQDLMPLRTGYNSGLMYSLKFPKDFSIIPEAAGDRI